MSVRRVSAGANVKGGREVVAQDRRPMRVRSPIAPAPVWRSYLLEGVLEVRNVDERSRLEPVPLVHFEVVPVRPFAGRAIAVVGIVDDRQVVSRSPLKVGQTDHLGDVRKLALWKVVADLVQEAGVWLFEERACGEGADDAGSERN